jgi:sporulation protein YlmC with PRC-barrel domain
MESTPQEITSLVGREVYSNNGVFVGEIEDIRLDLQNEMVTGLAVGSINKELLGTRISGSEGVIVPYRWVRAVGDIVLINDVVERLREPETEEATA